MVRPGLSDACLRRDCCDMHASGLAVNRVFPSTPIQHQRQYTAQALKGSQARYSCAGHSRLLKRSAREAGPVAMQELHTKQESACNDSSVKHLIVMANGLYGNSSNWDVVIEHLRKVLDTSETLLAASDANSLKQVRQSSILPSHIACF